MAYLERRREPRIRSNERVQIKILGDRSDEEISATVLDLSGKGLKIQSPIHLCPGTLLQIDSLTHRLLGEAMWCGREGNDYVVGVKVEHSVAHAFPSAAKGEARLPIQ